MPPAKNSTNESLHVLILDPLYHRGDLPGPARTFAIADELARTGHRVTILTSKTEANAESPLENNIHVIGIGAAARARYGYPLPSATNRSFTLNMLWRIWGIKDVDAVLSADRPVSCLPFALLFSWVRGAPIVLDAKSGIPPRQPDAAPVKRAGRWIAKTIYRWTAKLSRRVVVQDTRVQTALQISGISAAAIVESFPGCDTEHFKSNDGEKPTSANPIAVYAGRMSAGAGLDYVLEIAGEMKALTPEVGFYFYGDGTFRGQIEARALELGVLNKSVWIQDAVSRAQLPTILSGATIALARRHSITEAGPSGHVYDALASERPVVFTEESPLAELIVGRGAGIQLPSDNAKNAAIELAEYIKDNDSLRRAKTQSAALAAGRFNMARVAAEVREAMQVAVSEKPRAHVLHHRTLLTKRALDILISAFALIVLSPVFLVVAGAIYWKMGGPAVFSQERPGLKGKIFKIYKFRTMTETTDSSGALLSDDQRLTPLGKFLRRTSLDELPELLNVLMGDMSLVGPRPLLPEYLPYYSPEQRRRHDVRPGLTGWTQINGRNALTWEEKFELDVWYVDNLSLKLDAKILLKTIYVALRGEGVNAPGYATMPRFDEIMARREGAEDV